MSKKNNTNTDFESQCRRWNLKKCENNSKDPLWDSPVTGLVVDMWLLLTKQQTVSLLKKKQSKMNLCNWKSAQMWWKFAV